MAGPNRHNRFTVYDMMEAKGAFASNPANSDAQGPNGEVLYKGPVEFPKMLYHPDGDEKITVPAEVISTPFGPQKVGEQREIISQIVADAESEAKLVAAGWHLHPAQAIQAAIDAGTRTGVAPPISSDARIKFLEDQLAASQRELDKARGLSA